MPAVGYLKWPIPEARTQNISHQGQASKHNQGALTHGAGEIEHSLTALEDISSETIALAVSKTVSQWQQEATPSSTYH